MLDALEAHANVVDKDNSIYFVTALCALADEYDMGSLFREGHSRKLSLAVYRHLLSCDDYEERAKIIEYALRNSKSLLIVSNLLGHDRSVDAEKSLTSRVLNEAGTKRISIAYVEIFNDEIERSPSAFFCKKEFRSIFFAYSQINGKESLYNLLSKYIDEYTVVMLNAIKQTIESTDGVEFEIDKNDIESFFDVNRLKYALDFVVMDTIDESDKHLVEQAKRAIGTIEASISEKLETTTE